MKIYNEPKQYKLVKTNGRKIYLSSNMYNHSQELSDYSVKENYQNF